MTFELASIVFITTGTILFLTVLEIGRCNILIALLLATLSILWAVFSLKYWLPTFPDKFQWCGILTALLGILSSVTILSKSGLPAKEK